MSGFRFWRFEYIRSHRRHNLHLPNVRYTDLLIRGLVLLTLRDGVPVLLMFKLGGRYYIPYRARWLR